MPYQFQVTFDCRDIETMTHFWATALNYSLQEPPEGFSSWADFAVDQGIPESQWRGAVTDPEGKGPRLYFQPVPEGKTAKNRVHLDINVSEGAATMEEGRAEAQAHVDRCVKAGATVTGVFEGNNDWHIVMADPEGNEFCIQ
ncbi:VOC family protein [Paeniglutamicibacter sp. ABSL32-1]|uniref:VOC family protein n=1 Tax=Paeniglutamicibacter quisquiliarum TaxID=2849498 RepID=UPI001C2DCE21|nr:VOC family protein [Paeniglutamicibacter quisquiliarum]